MRPVVSSLFGSTLRPAVQRPPPFIQAEARRTYARTRFTRPQAVRTVRIVREKVGIPGIVLLGTGVVLGTAGYIFGDEIKYWSTAATRSARVVRALYINISE